MTAPSVVTAVDFEHRKYLDAVAPDLADRLVWSITYCAEMRLEFGHLTEDQRTAKAVRLLDQAVAFLLLKISRPDTRWVISKWVDIAQDQFYLYTEHIRLFFGMYNNGIFIDHHPLPPSQIDEPVRLDYLEATISELRHRGALDAMCWNSDFARCGDRPNKPNGPTGGC